MIKFFENILSASEISQFNEYLAKSEDWDNGASTAGELAGSVKNNKQLAESCELAVSLGNHILRKLGQHEAFVSFALPDKIYPPRFNQYSQKEHYGFHVDSAVMQIPDSRQSMRTDLSGTLFLTDPDTYIGGELQFQLGEEIQSIKLAAGSMVVYPSNTLHQVTPVSTGVRTCSFFWIQSMVRNLEQRLLLHELDSSIQHLRRTNSDAEGIKSLSKVYHNLLRQWVEV